MLTTSEAKFLQKSVKSESVELSSLDMIISITTMPLFFHYRNTDGNADFMSSDILRSSFIAVLQEYPLMLGHLCQKEMGHCYINIDNNNLNTPVYKEAQSSMHFDELQKAHFDPEHLQPSPDKASFFLAGSLLTGAIKLVNVYINRFKDNSGVTIFISVAHALIDFHGLVMFMNRWAEIYRQIQNGVSLDNITKKLANYDRSIISKLIPPPENPPADSLKKMQLDGGLLSKWLAWLSPAWRGSLFDFSIGFAGTTSCCFHISRSSLDELHKLICDNSTAGQRISDNDVLVAVYNIVYAQSIAAEENEKINSGILGRLSNYLLRTLSGYSDTFVYTFPVSLRPRIKNQSLDDYTGNAFTSAIVFNPVELLNMPATPQVIAQVAANTRKAVDSVDENYISHTVTGMTPPTDIYMRPFVYNVLVPGLLSSTNLTRFNMYSVDFGWGIPEWVGPHKSLMPKVAAFLPSHPSVGGYYMHIADSPSTLKHIQQNTLWCKYVERSY
ncbi:hypothetical protein COEREDRAFT_88363 [Coemansia reversa NRRL 1564]|uniref:Transferase-domain-containing protein n=1 Tax=Coemansia reversa (strain ATCC 12441 / NRRL 1564) TaxID=763665 RepID=A0A2G5B756_COERN|nr:hypothetical protein COEREDRAFT_88363 [Coemansia reversa NRRL 1564]|eukprot:PIA14839.1 hypothetical protein COEREDRAFT_88363 [Coemansia reversa NRRL 1564]